MKHSQNSVGRIFAAITVVCCTFFFLLEYNSEHLSTESQAQYEFGVWLNELEVINKTNPASLPGIKLWLATVSPEDKINWEISSVDSLENSESILNILRMVEGIELLNNPPLDKPRFLTLSIESRSVQFKATISRDQYHRSIGVRNFVKLFEIYTGSKKEINSRA